VYPNHVECGGYATCSTHSLQRLHTYLLARRSPIYRQIRESNSISLPLKSTIFAHCLMKSSQIPCTDVQCALGCRFIAANFLWRQSNCAARPLPRRRLHFMPSLCKNGEIKSLFKCISARVAEIYSHSL
jgi:hypothetical protein